jgi:Transglycosylase SLT domain
VRVKEVSGRIGCQPEELLAVMMSESSVWARAQNPHGQATGLIQIMPANLPGVGWTAGPDAFRQLSAEDQMPYVERYYRPWVHHGLHTAARLYQSTFLPATLATVTTSEGVLAAPGGPYPDAYKWNHEALDVNHDGQITLGDLEARLANVRSGPRWNAIMARLAAV